MPSPPKAELAPADRAQILERWQEASSWVADQLRELRRLERSTGHREDAIRRALDRPDPDDAQGGTPR